MIFQEGKHLLVVNLTSSSASPPAINLFSIGRVRSHAPSRVQTDSPFLPSRFFLLHLLVKFHDPLMPSGEQKGEGEGVSLTYSTRPRSRRRGHKMVPETAAGMVVEAVGQMKVRGHRSLPSKGSIHSLQYDKNKLNFTNPAQT